MKKTGPGLVIARKELSDFTLRITRDAIYIETRATEPSTKAIDTDEWTVSS